MIRKLCGAKKEQRGFGFRKAGETEALHGNIGLYHTCGSGGVVPGRDKKYSEEKRRLWLRYRSEDKEQGILQLLRMLRRDAASGKRHNRQRLQTLQRQVKKEAQGKVRKGLSRNLCKRQKRD